jgi:uncharacterized protein
MGFLDRYATPRDLPASLPVFPLTGALLLPRIELPLNIFEPRYLKMFDDAMTGNRLVGMIQPKPGDLSDVPELSSVGCAGRITSFTETPDGRLLISLTGVSRFRLVSELETITPYRIIEPDYESFAADLVVGTGTTEVNRNAVLKAFRDYLEANDMTTNWDEIESVNTEQLVNTLSLMAPYPAHEKQALLEAGNLKDRADMLVALTELALTRQGGDKNRTLQ